MLTPRQHMQGIIAADEAEIARGVTPERLAQLQGEIAACKASLVSLPPDPSPTATPAK